MSQKYTYSEVLDALTRKKLCNSVKSDADCPAEKCEDCPWDVWVYEWDDVLDVAIKVLQEKVQEEAIVNDAIIDTFGGKMRDMTPEESEKYEQSLKNVYKPAAINIDNLVDMGEMK